MDPLAVALVSVGAVIAVGALVFLIASDPASDDFE